MSKTRGNDEDLEIFTDLNGAPDKAVVDDVELLDDPKLGTKTGKEGEDDDDLAIVDEAAAEEEEAEEGAAATEDETESANEEASAAEDVAQADPEILFDPKDVQLIISESEKIELRENTEKAALARAKSDVEEAKTAMEKAMEDGNSKDHIKAAEKFADAKGAVQTANARLENIASEKGHLTARAKAIIAKAPKNEKGEAIVDKVVFAKPAAASRPAPKETSASKLATKFIELNPWFNDPAKKSQREMLMGIDRALAAEKKLDKNSPEYFAEMGRRFNKQHPGVFKNLDGKLVATGQRQRGAGTGVPGQGGAGGGRQEQQAGKIRLTGEDVAQMKIFNLDPDDPKVRRSWLNEKIAGSKRAA